MSLNVLLVVFIVIFFAVNILLAALMVARVRNRFNKTDRAFLKKVLYYAKHEYLADIDPEVFWSFAKTDICKKMVARFFITGPFRVHSEYYKYRQNDKPQFLSETAKFNLDDTKFF